MGFGALPTVEERFDHHPLGVHHVNELIPKNQRISWDILTAMRGRNTDGPRSPVWSGAIANPNEPSEADDVLVWCTERLSEVLASAARGNLASLSSEPG